MSESLHDQRPDVALVGTSNGVYHGGYASALAACTRFASFSNFSVGMSTSELFVFRRHGERFRYDVCVLEFACNDAAALRFGETSLDRVRQVLSEAIEFLEERRCQPILFLMPFRGAPQILADLRTLYASLAFDYGIPCFDGQSVVEQLALTQGCSEDSLYHDDPHLRGDVAFHLGELLSAFIVENLKHRNMTPRRKCTKKNFFIGADEFQNASSPVTLRRTDLLSCKILLVSEGESIIVSTDGFSKIIALAVDFSVCAGVLHIEGDDRISIRFAPHGDIENARMLARVFPLRQPIGSQTGHFILRACSDGPAEMMFSRQPFSATAGAIALIGAIMQAA
ncbi:hypothetical protein [Methylobacterium nonmethylotrophicum]|uniref:Uncharacterized protein n=1 Tax=Methylobacterium nonmethylotrophicum TaxID=1141884 RepID=A0A4Z0NLS3_9HYPH|nr:hypothetical protein [Methylobacterium nonmethylotrophicum]TGD96911.1 hypothetical protein EU555_21230 [Methylobacterium nonmethylotrophicum]